MADEATGLRTTTSTRLLEGLRDGANRTIWRQYVDRYRPLIVGYATKLGLRPEDAEDAAQDTLLEFSKSYRSGKYSREKGRLRSWLFGIAHNQIRNRRRRNRDRDVPIGEAGDLVAHLESPSNLEELWDREWRDAIFRQCIEEVRREIQPRTLQAFELFVVQGLAADEVAERLQMTSNAVFCAKHRTLKRIRELFPLVEDIW